MSDHGPEGIGQGFKNWRASDLGFGGKLRLVLKNNAFKIKNRRRCCGNHGDPGC